jgi:hypothetical protein
MATARRRLEVAPMPGYYLYWFKEEHLDAAVRAYYEPVKRDEVSLNQVNVAGSAGQSGNTDMGSNVSLVCGTNEKGEPQRMHLMKLKEELHMEDEAEKLRRILQPFQAVFGDEASAIANDPMAYVDRSRTSTNIKSLMNRPVRKAKIGPGRFTP